METIVIPIVFLQHINDLVFYFTYQILFSRVNFSLQYYIYIRNQTIVIPIVLIYLIILTIE